MNATPNRIRQLDLLALLLSRRAGVPHDDVYALVEGGGGSGGVSRDTLETRYRRDRAALEEAGVRFTVGPDGLRADPASLYGASHAPDFTEGEREVLAAAGAARFGTPELDAIAAGAHRKIAAHAPRAVPRPSGRFSVAADGITLSAGELSLLAGAVRDRTAVHFWYASSPDRDDALRELEPWAIALHRGRLYLAGHDRDRGEPRVFRLANVADPVLRTIDVDGEPVPSPARRPRPAAGEIEALVARAHEMGEGACDVVVQIDPGTCADVTERAEDLGGGRWLLRGVGAHRARRLALERATRLAVLEPAWLRERVVDALRAAADQGGADVR